jgi:hypothetical protein
MYIDVSILSYSQYFIAPTLPRPDTDYSNFIIPGGKYLGFVL